MWLEIADSTSNPIKVYCSLLSQLCQKNLEVHMNMHQVIALLLL